MIFDTYQKRKRENEITFGKLLDVNLNPEQTKETNDTTSVSFDEKKLVNISDEEGMRRAKTSPQGLYQYYNKLYIYGTRDKRDVIGDVLIPFDKSLEMPRGRAANAAIMGHREIDTVIGYSMGGSVALALEENTHI